MATDWRVARRTFESSAGKPVSARLEAVLGLIMAAEAGATSAGARAAFWSELTAGQRAMLAVTLFEMEVNGGGFDSYLRYSAGDLADDALAGLRTIAATGFADALAGAMKLFPRGRPAPGTDERAEQLDGVLAKSPAALGRFDDAFFSAYYGPESLGGLQIAYIEANPSEFFKT